MQRKTEAMLKAIMDNLKNSTIYLKRIDENIPMKGTILEKIDRTLDSVVEALGNPDVVENLPDRRAAIEATKANLS